MTTERAPLHRYYRLMAVLRLSALVYLLLILLLRWSVLAINMVLMIAGGVVVGFNSLLYGVGRRKARRMLMDKVQGRIHEAIEVSSVTSYYPLTHHHMHIYITTPPFW